MEHHVITVEDALRKLSVQDFLNMGIDQIAYIKPLEAGKSEPGFAIHAADGRQISVIDSYMSAVALIHQNDMHAVTVH